MDQPNEAPPRIGRMPELEAVAAWAGKAFAAGIARALQSGSLTPLAAIEICDTVLTTEAPFLHDGEGKAALANIQGAVIRACLPAVQLAAGQTPT